jgi:hypothetical protein
LSGVCSDYCIFTENKTFYKESQAVIFFRTLNAPPPIKIVNQKWIYLTFEPPIKQQAILPRKPWIEILESFDWLMSYERNSDLGSYKRITGGVSLFRNLKFICFRK